MYYYNIFLQSKSLITRIVFNRINCLLYSIKVANTKHEMRPVLRESCVFVLSHTTSRQTFQTIVPLYIRGATCSVGISFYCVLRRIVRDGWSYQ